MELEKQVLELVIRVIHESTGREIEIGPGDRLIDDGYLDSFSMVNLVMAIQMEFQVELDIADMNETSFGSAVAIAALIREREAA